MTTAHTVAVPGRGRMGGALTTRLAARGRDIVGWARSGRASDTARTTADPNDADPNDADPNDVGDPNEADDRSDVGDPNEADDPSAADPALPAAVSGTPSPGPDPAVGEDVLVPLRAYVRGHATGDPAHFRDAFLPTAHVEGIRDGAFVSWRLEEYCALFSGRPAPDEATRSRRIDAVDVHGTVATAAMTLRHGADTFTDVFLLVHADGGWRIANKVYHRHG